MVEGKELVEIARLEPSYTITTRRCQVTIAELLVVDASPVSY